MNNNPYNNPYVLILQHRTTEATDLRLAITIPAPTIIPTQATITTPTNLNHMAPATITTGSKATPTTMEAIMARKTAARAWAPCAARAACLIAVYVDLRFISIIDG